MGLFRQSRQARHARGALGEVPPQVILRFDAADFVIKHGSDDDRAEVLALLGGRLTSQQAIIAREHLDGVTARVTGLNGHAATAA